MRDLAGIPNYKVLLHIASGNGNADVLLDEIFLAIHEHICQFVDPIPFSIFKSHTKVASDKGVRVNIASSHAAPPFRKISWATRMSLMDSIVKRRRWTVHIGLHYEAGDSSVKLFYAEYYSDFTAGRLAAPPPPPKITPFFIHTFVCNPAFQCVAENYPLPYL